MCEVTGSSQETVPEVAFKYAEALCGGWPQELVTPRGLRVPSSTLSDRPSACLAPCLGQEKRADKLPCACSCPSVGAELLLCTRLNSLLEMADDHEILFRAGKGSQDACPCLPGHARPSSLAPRDGLPVPLCVPSRLGRRCTRQRGVHGEGAGCTTCRSPRAGAPCEGSPFLPASWLSAVSWAHGTRLALSQPNLHLKAQLGLPSGPL